VSRVELHDSLVQGLDWEGDSTPSADGEETGVIEKCVRTNSRPVEATGSV